MSLWRRMRRILTADIVDWARSMETCGVRLMRFGFSYSVLFCSAFLERSQWMGDSMPAVKAAFQVDFASAKAMLARQVNHVENPARET